jgi:FixJ family two-component response regulator
MDRTTFSPTSVSHSGTAIPPGPTNGTPPTTTERTLSNERGVQVSPAYPASSQSSAADRAWTEATLALVGAASKGLEGILESLNDRYQQLRRFDDYEAAIDGLPPMSVGCVVGEWQTPDGHAHYFLRELARRRSPLAPVFLASQVPASEVSRAMSNGAHSFVDWPSPASQLAAAIQDALQASEDLARHCREVASLASRVALLTDNEKLVLQMAVDGVPNKIIAGRLDIALRTVELRRQSIFRKMACDSICELVQQVTRGRELARLLERRFRASRSDGTSPGLQII